jgi:GNAT superfamily N-acetyltransferase
MAHAPSPAAQGLALPPALVPHITPLAAAPVTLRRLELADNAAAFAVCEAAFQPPESLTGNQAAICQQRWDAWGRAWYGWLHSQARDDAWAAVTESGDLAGFARAVRDDAQRIEILTDLYVRSEFQGAQLGKTLLQGVLEPHVASGWRRIIVANPDLRALALYHRWGTLPLGTAWCGMLAPGATLQAHAAKRLDAESSRGVTVRPAQMDRDEPFIARLDRTALGFTRLQQLHFMLGFPGVRLLALKRSGEIMGYGVRMGGFIGPVVGKTSADVLTLAAAHLVELADEGSAATFWAPGANAALWRWLALPDLRLTLAGQVTLMASDPSLVATLDRVLLTAPPYVI